MFPYLCYVISLCFAPSSFKAVNPYKDQHSVLCCPASSGAQSVLLPVASELSVQFSGGEEGTRGALDLLHIDRKCDYRCGEKGGKNQATVTPDHYPLSAAFTNCIKGRLVKMMLQNEKKKKQARWRMLLEH